MRTDPPKKALRFLRWFCREDFIDEIEGDLREVFNKQYLSSPLKAKWNFAWSVVKYFRPEFIKSLKPRFKSNPTAMFRHNMLITIRNFRRYKVSFFINLIGLSSALTSVLLIYLWIHCELSIDKFHQKDDQLFEVFVNYHFPEGIKTWEATPLPLAEALVEQMPEVEYAVSVNTFTDWFSGPGIISHEDVQVKAKGIFATKDYFNIFSYPLIAGENDKVLSEKNGIVISERLAIKLFKTTEDVVGKTVQWNHTMQLDGPLQITGIFENTPDNSTYQFDVVFNFKKLVEGDQYADEWNSSYAETFLLLRKGTEVNTFNQKISGILSLKNPALKSSLFVIPFSSKYLFGQFENGVQADGRITYVYMFSTIAFLILVVACINFMNLSTAQASYKTKEIGVKKSLGINRSALVTQFFGESILLSFLAFALALLFVILLLPQFNELTDKQLHLNLTPSIIVSSFVIVLLTGLLSGWYPAFYLSKLNPIAILKGKLKSSFNELLVRKGLVIVQFTVSIVFIVAFIIINKQIKFTQSKHLGYDKENIIRFSRQGNIERNNHEVLFSELKKIPGVENLSCMFGSILEKNQALHRGFSWKGQAPDEKEMHFASPSISHNFIETMGLKLLEGRTFSQSRANEESKVIINEVAAKMMGLQNPIGEIINYGSNQLQIIGIVKDFQYGSLHHKIEPVFFMYAAYRNNIVVKIQKGSERETLARIEDVYKKFHPGYPFEFTFLDDDYQKLYESENRVGVLSQYFAAVAIIISCLGLYGLAAFTAKTKEKEICVRKILGATDFSIIRLFSMNFTNLILLASLIAIPLSYFISYRWLGRFAYRINMDWWLFASAVLVALTIAFLTIGLQTIRASRINPAEALKNE